MVDQPFPRGGARRAALVRRLGLLGPAMIIVLVAVAGERFDAEGVAWLCGGLLLLGVVTAVLVWPGASVLTRLSTLASLAMVVLLGWMPWTPMWTELDDRTRRVGLLAVALAATVLVLNVAVLTRPGMAPSTATDPPQPTSVSDSGPVSTDLSGAGLRRADLQGADLRGVTARGADLTRARLRGADLRGADFTDATLIRADLTGAQVDGAIWTGAKLDRARLPSVLEPPASPTSSTTA